MTQTSTTTQATATTTPLANGSYVRWDRTGEYGHVVVEGKLGGRGGRTMVYGVRLDNSEDVIEMRGYDLTLVEAPTCSPEPVVVDPTVESIRAALDAKLADADRACTTASGRVTVAKESGSDEVTIDRLKVSYDTAVAVWYALKDARAAAN